jgi:hypothetical protein
MLQQGKSWADGLSLSALDPTYEVIRNSHNTPWKMQYTPKLTPTSAMEGTTQCMKGRAVQANMNMQTGRAMAPIQLPGRTCYEGYGV